MSILSSRCSVLTAALIGSALALGSTLISKPAFAATATANMSVSATVPATCTIATGDMIFGNYSSTEDTTAETTITATCSSGTNAIIGLNTGVHGSDGNLELLNTSGTGRLDYGIYLDNQHVAVWGEIGDQNTQKVVPNGNPQAFIAYGVIYPGQSVPVGNYSDTVTVTITY